MAVQHVPKASGVSFPSRILAPAIMFLSTREKFEGQFSDLKGAWRFMDVGPELHPRGSAPGEASLMLPGPSATEGLTTFHSCDKIPDRKTLQEGLTFTQPFQSIMVEESVAPRKQMRSRPELAGLLLFLL